MKDNEKKLVFNFINVIIAFIASLFSTLLIPLASIVFLPTTPDKGGFGQLLIIPILAIEAFIFFFVYVFFLVRYQSQPQNKVLLLTVLLIFIGTSLLNSLLLSLG